MKTRAMILSTVSLAAVLSISAVASAATGNGMTAQTITTTKKADATAGRKADASINVADATPPAKPAAPAAAAPSAPDAAADTGEEMTVTARRRAEKLINVPAAVTAMTGDQLEQLGVQNTQDLLAQVAGATVASSGPGFLTDVSMRGQGSGRNGFSETATGIYENGAYIAGGGFGGRSLNEMNLFDIQRVEVLHGPQGALYGRNAVGGAINVIVNPPEQDFSAKEQFTYGSQQSYDMQGYVNVPLDPANGIAARVGGFDNNQVAGFIRNLDTGDWVDAAHSRGLRAGLMVNPNEDLKIYGQFEFYQNTQPSFGTLGYVQTLDGTDPYERQHMNREGKQLATDSDGFIAVDKTTSIGDASLKLYRRSRDANRTNEDYDHYLGLSLQAIGGAPIDLAQGQKEGFDLLNAQFTLASNGTGRWKWLVGLESLNTTDSIAQGIEDCGTFNSGNNPPALYAGCTAGARVTGADPSFATLQALRAAMNHDAYTTYLSSVAGFGTLSFDITPRITLGIEGRVAKDMESQDFQRYSQDPLTWWGNGAAPSGYYAPGAASYCPPDVSTALAGCAAHPTYYAHLDTGTHQVLPAASINFKITPKQSAYLRYATGYRPGGFNNPFSGVNANYKPERSSSYELGWKGDVLGMDASSDIYYQTTRDVQLTTYAAGGIGFFIQNPGNQYVYGAEASLSKKIRIGKGTLQPSLSVSSDYGRYYDCQPFVPASGSAPVNINGDRVAYTNNIQGALGATYQLPISAGLKGSIGANWTFSSGGYRQPQPGAAQDPGYGKLDLTASLLSSQGWVVKAFVKNTFDQVYNQFAIGNAQFWSTPRTTGISLTLLQ